MSNDDGSVPSAIASQLVRAWRERWTDVQWSVHLKTLLPRSAPKQHPGDAYHLADLLLKQSVIGISPNTLILSYFRHAAVSGIIRVCTALDSIMKYDDIDKPYCTQSLLMLATAIVSHVRDIGGGMEGNVELGHVLLKLVHWFLCIAEKCLQQLPNNPSQVSSVLSVACDGVTTAWESGITSSLMIIAKAEYQAAFDEIETMATSVRGAINLLENTHQQNFTVELAEKSKAVLQTVESISKDEVWEKKASSDTCSHLLNVSHQSINISINVLLSIEALLNSTTQLSSFVCQIQCIKKTQGLTDTEVYCELIRSCFMGLVQSCSDDHLTLKWAALAYMKLPKAVEMMSKQSSSEQLFLAVESLLNFVPLLDLTDTKCSADCLSLLLTEFSKLHLLSENQIKQLLARRHAERQFSPKKPDQQIRAGNLGSVQLLLRSEQTATTILTTLDVDLSGSLEHVVTICSGMVSAMNLDRIMAVAAAHGKLKNFAAKLIKLNEMTKQAQVNESPKAAQTRALVFDITFLLLCHVTWLHRSEVLSSPEAAHSSFVQWASRSFPDKGSFKSPFLPDLSERSKVDSLLGLLKSNTEFKTSMTRWHEMITTLPYVMREVLVAWQCSALDEDAVKGLLANLRRHMCCLPVIASAWLCSYIDTCKSSCRQKPMLMLKWLISSENPSTQDSSISQLYSERSHLMNQNMKLLGQGLLSSTPPPHTLPLMTPALDLMKENLKVIFKKGCIDVDLIQDMQQLLQVAGPQWFTWHLVQEMLNFDRPDYLCHAVSLIYSLMHLDLKNCINALLKYVVPQLLRSKQYQDKVMDPKGNFLATLTVMCINAMCSMSKDSTTSTNSRKRGRSQVDLSDSEGETSPANKLRRLSDASVKSNDPFSISDFLSSKESPTAPESVPTVIRHLFMVLREIVSTNNIGPQTSFLLSILQQIVKAPPETAALILKDLPQKLVSDLLCLMPSDFDISFLLKLCDLNLREQRVFAAKNIALCSRYKAQNVQAL